MRLLEPLAEQPGARICLLGAGNCDDVDLPQLVSKFREIHLVDIDRQALRRGVAAQEVEGRSELHLHGGVDITGVESILEQWHANAPEPPAIDSCILLARDGWAPDLGERFNVVVSSCVLTQLINAVVHSLDPTHPATVQLILTIRDRHLRLMGELLVPGGTGVLVTDIVSSDTVPQLSQIPALQLPVLLEELIRTRNFFTGVNPCVLVSRLSHIGDNVSLIRPWVWTMEPQRSYLVCAITFQAKIR
jgi:hypothetical protein